MAYSLLDCQLKTCILYTKANEVKIVAEMSVYMSNTTFYRTY